MHLDGFRADAKALRDCFGLRPLCDKSEYLALAAGQYGLGSIFAVDVVANFSSTIGATAGLI